MRKRWIYVNGEAIEISEYQPPEPTGPAVMGDLPGYVSEATGLWIEGRKARREDLKRSGCRPWEGLETEKKEVVRQQAYREQQSDRALERAAGEVYAAFMNESRGKILRKV